MSHRAQGIVVLTLAALIALIILKLGGTPIPGTPTALSIQTPPLVGSCILNNPTADGRRLGSTSPLTYGACGQPHYGEVVQVFRDGAKFPRIGLDPLGSPDPSSCTQVVGSYLGVDQITVRNDRDDYRVRRSGPGNRCRSAESASLDQLRCNRKWYRGELPA